MVPAQIALTLAKTAIAPVEAAVALATIQVVDTCPKMTSLAH